MMCSLVGDQLGGGRQERLKERGTFEVGCCAGGKPWDVCGCEVLAYPEGRKDFRLREENMQRRRGMKVHDVSMSIQPPRWRLQCVGDKARDS